MDSVQIDFVTIFILTTKICEGFSQSNIISQTVHYIRNFIGWENSNMVKFTQLSILMARCFRTRESVASVLWTYPIDDVIKWKHFPRYWPFVRGIHRSPVNSPHKGQWRGALMFSLICVWIKDWVNNGKAGDLRRYRAHYGVTVMKCHHLPGLMSCVYCIDIIQPHIITVTS